MTTIQFLSPEWIHEAKYRLRTQASPETLKQMTTSVLIVYRNCPDGNTNGVHFRVNNGSVEDVSISVDNYPAAEFTITGDYATYIRILRAELSSSEAMMNGLLHLEGNMFKALTLVPIVDRLNGILAQIPCEY